MKFALALSIGSLLFVLPLAAQEKTGAAASAARGSAGPVSAGSFAPGFDVLHRTFLGYPARLAPPGRQQSFLELYQGTVARHAEKGAQRSRFTPAEAGWAAVCYGLVRHPEFNLY